MSKPSTGIGRPWLPTRLDGRGLRRQFTRWGAGVGFPMLTLVQLRAEDQAGRRHEFYQEDNGRISLRADSIRVVSSL